MKFVKLLKKELLELITLQSIIGLLVGVIMFVLLGSVMDDVGERVSQNSGSVVVADQDGSALSKKSIEELKTAGFEVHTINNASDIELTKSAAAFDHSSVLVIPAGFGEGIENGTAQSLRIVSEMKNFSLTGNMDTSASSAAEMITENVRSTQLETLSSSNAEFLKAPVTTTDTTVVRDKTADINPSLLQSFATQQSMFIPLIVFILVIFASQLNASAIANEKGDKTLETLLSAPVSRLSVLGAKMCASAVFSLLMAAVYMIGFSSYMGGMMSGVTGGASGEAATATSDVLRSLGLELGIGQFALIGLQLFLTISIALTISMILGALAKDLKAAQGMLAPMMFVVMIPYILSVFVDTAALPVVGRILYYAIPFTHTFTASSSLLFGDMTAFFGGMLYQLVFLAVALFLAVRIFSSDKIFTMTLDFKRKRRRKTVPNE